MNPPRLTTARLRQLAHELPDQQTAVLLHLAAARVLSGHQLDRLLTETGTPAKATERARQRTVTRLCDLGLADTLERRVGGARAGSAGYVQVLTPAGHKLAALLQNQPPPGRVRHSRRPGPMFIAHALAIAEIYVQLIEASRDGSFQLKRFVTEPACWWPTGGGIYLRPDAYAALAVPTHQDCWWLEIDRDTESIPRLKATCTDYLDHATHGGTGPNGVPPRVLFTAPDQRRAEAIHKVIAKLPHDTDLITVTTHDQAADFLINELHTT